MGSNVPIVSRVSEFGYAGVRNIYQTPFDKRFSPRSVIRPRSIRADIFRLSREKSGCRMQMQRNHLKGSLESFVHCGYEVKEMQSKIRQDLMQSSTLWEYEIWQLWEIFFVIRRSVAEFLLIICPSGLM